MSTMLKDNKEILSKKEDGMLFGKEFKDQILKEYAKNKKKSKEAFDNSPRCSGATSVRSLGSAFSPPIFTR